MTPLHRACVALRLPRGLYCYSARADVPLSDAEIRLALRRQHVATERIVSHFEHPVRLLADFADLVVTFEAWRRGEDLP